MQENLHRFQNFLGGACPRTTPAWCACQHVVVACGAYLDYLLRLLPHPQNVDPPLAYPVIRHWSVVTHSNLLTELNFHSH